MEQQQDEALAIQRTFPKKGATNSDWSGGGGGSGAGGGGPKDRKYRLKRKKFTQKYIHSIFNESDGDFSEDEAHVEVERKSEKRGAKKKAANNRIAFAKKSAGKKVSEGEEESEVKDADDDKFDTYKPPEDDGFETWIPPPPNKDRKYRVKKVWNKQANFARTNVSKVEKMEEMNEATVNPASTPSSNSDEFDTWIPPAPEKDRFFEKKGKQQFRVKINCWRDQMRSMFAMETTNDEAVSSSAVRAVHANENGISDETRGDDVVFLDEREPGFIGPKRRVQRISAQTLRAEGADLNSANFREEIANIPLGKAKQLQERLGTKLFDKAFFPGIPANDLNNNQDAQRIFVRDNPKRPREVSSKVPVSKFRNVFENEKLERDKLDPRFDERCGEYNDYIYRNNYGFLNEIRQHEKQVLIEELNKVKKESGDGSAKGDRLKEALKKMNNQEKTQAEIDRHKEIMRQIRHENNERMRQGLPPIFRTRAQIRWLEWQKKSEELKKGNKLDKYLQRRAKKYDRKRAGSLPSL